MSAKELTVEITSKCFLECEFCSASAGPNGKHVLRSLVINTLEEYTLECETVRFSGGEPLLHPDIMIFLKHADKLGYRIALMTNGLMMFESAYIDEYIVHATCMQALEYAVYLKGLGRGVSMHVVAAEKNEPMIAIAIPLCMEHKIPIRILKLQHQGRGRNWKSSELVTFTGDTGCSEYDKITVTHDGRHITCSALKEGRCTISGPASPHLIVCGRQNL